MSTASSSITGGGGRLGRNKGIPSKCWCGEDVTPLISKSKPNPFRRYYRCVFAAKHRLENDGHLFKWVDEAFTDEIKQLEYQCRVLEEKVQILKEIVGNGGDLREGPKIMPRNSMIKISGGCVLLTVVLVLGIAMYKK